MEPTGTYGTGALRDIATISSIAAAGLLLLAAFALAFLYAPVDASMGIVQKIFYFHAPAAYAMYLSWAACTAASIAYLARRREIFDAVAVSAAEVALVFAGIVMVTGPLWGRKAWGAFWTWDPRLTASLLLALVIAGYVLLRNLAAGEAERRFAAALAVLGACIVPLIHLSVQKWRGQHPTVITAKGGGLAPEMLLAFALALVAFTALAFVLIARRTALELSRRELDALVEEARVQGRLRGDGQ